MLSDIESPEFGRVRFTIPMRVADPYLCEIVTVQGCDALDGPSLEQHTVLEITTQRCLFVRVSEGPIRREEIDGWARRAVYAMTWCRDERPAIAASVLREVGFKVLLTFRPVEVRE